MILQLAKGGFICRSCRITLSRQSKRRISTDAQDLPPHRVQLRNPRNVPTFPARTRFAPSPTGNLHLGSLRTALYNYLIARRTGGQFILRIEDTDTKRTIPGAEERIYKDLRWAGLEWDEGPEIGGQYGPYRQSERRDLYHTHATQLLDSGHAYRCFCDQEELRARSELAGEGGYDRHCYHLSEEESHDRAHQGQSFVVRLKAADIPPKIKDLTYGKVVLPRGGKDHSKFRDPVLVKADGLPTYHFANVVDDHYMQITHVIRGVEWLISTPLHVELYRAFGWDEPLFCHVGLLLDQDGLKLSKRAKSFNMSSMQESGVLPEALNNFLVLQGWSHPDKHDFKTLQQLEEEFTLKFGKKSPTVSMAKLDFLSPKHAGERIKNGGQPYEDMLDLVMNHVRVLCNDNPHKLVPVMLQDLETQRRYVDSILRLDAKNYKNAADYIATHAYFFLERSRSQILIARGKRAEDKSVWDEKEPQLKDKLIAGFTSLESDPAGWNHDTINKVISEVQSALVAAPFAPIPEKAGERFVSDWVWEHIRAYVCFGERGPSVADAMTILGSAVVLDRIKNIEVVRTDPQTPKEPANEEEDAMVEGVKVQAV